MKSHMKRIAAPKTWAIARKETKFITNPRAGPHPKKAAMPLSLIIKDVLNLAMTTRHARFILQKKSVLIDGKTITEKKYPVGLMDTISIPESGLHFRMLINKKGKLILEPIKQNEANSKTCQVKSKVTIKTGKTQLGLHDGRSVIVDDGSKYSTGDSLVINLPEQEVKQHLKLQKKSAVFLTAGKHIGSSGTVEDVKGSKLAVKIGEETVETKKEFAFVTG